MWRISRRERLYPCRSLGACPEPAASRDIRSTSPRRVKPDFHARFSARASSTVCRPCPPASSALLRDRGLAYNRKLNLAAMGGRARHPGSESMTSPAFRSSACSAKGARSGSPRADNRSEGRQIEFILEADAFLMHRPGTSVGTLVEVGLGRFSPDEVKAMLKSRDRTPGRRTGPGLRPPSLSRSFIPAGRLGPTAEFLYSLKKII